MSRRLVTWGVLVCLGLLCGAPAWAQTPAGKPGPRQAAAVSLQNEYIKVLVSPQGMLALRTTGGNPASASDDDKPLLYNGPQGGEYTSYASLRVIRSGVSHDYKLYDQAMTLTPEVQGEWIVAQWLCDEVEVTQQVRIARNPHTTRDDLMEIAYTLHNLGATAVQAGVRCELDIQVGGNDQAPFYLPDGRQITREVAFSAANMPAYYKGFESPSFNEDSLRTLAILREAGMTTPDRLIIATYRPEAGGGLGIGRSTWDYVIDPHANLGDSATAAYFGPRDLGPGQQFTVRTGYGLGDVGGDATLAAPTELACDQALFAVTLHVTNRRNEALVNGQATLDLPQGLALAPGQSAQVGLGSLAAGGVSSVAWQVQSALAAPGSYALAAEVRFDNLDEALRPQATVHMAPCVPDATPTPAPEPTATPPPAVPEPASLWLLATGLGGLAGGWALRRRRC